MRERSRQAEKGCSPLQGIGANVTSSFIPYYHQTMEGEGEKNTTGCFSEQKKYNNYDYLMIGHLPLHCKIETNRALKINILTYHISWVTYNVRSYKIVPSSFSHQNIVSVKRNLYALCKYCERIYIIRLHIILHFGRKICKITGRKQRLYKEVTGPNICFLFR